MARLTIDSMGNDGVIRARVTMEEPEGGKLMHSRCASGFRKPRLAFNSEQFAEARAAVFRRDEKLSQQLQLR